METGRVIHRRYLLQRLIKQGQYCAIYQGTDQVLQRAVAVKVVPAAHIPAYRAAIRVTSQFSHPNIIGIYDLIIEPETLYVVQEYVDGEDFGMLLQTQQMPFQVADLGVQICQALLYTSSSARRVCHGDLTPGAIMRDQRGLVRINNFALPGDRRYFDSWSVVGGDGLGLSDQELPWGQMTDGRRADDTRAVGILLYQLLAGRTPGATSVEPSVDGRIRFLRNVPPELCEVIARTIVRQHPQHIITIEELHTELKALADTYEPPLPVVPSVGFQGDEGLRARSTPLPGTGKLVTALPAREGMQQSMGLAAFRPAAADTSTPVAAMDAPASPTVADVSLKLASARQAAYPSPSLPNEPTTRRISIPILIAISIVIFLLFFAIGYVVATGVFR